MISVNQKVQISLPNSIELVIKREDQIHPLVSGNKYRKLKYNLRQAVKENKDTLLTFGGAYSNHILAVAAAAHIDNLKSIGVIRGEELATKVASNPTLSLAESMGMKFEFVTREQYRTKTDDEFVNSLRYKYGDFYMVPEGGTNALAVKGCEEILNPEDAIFDYVCSAVGTGGTLSGISRSAHKEQKILGFSSLKTDYLKTEIHKFAPLDNWRLITDYHFGGYGKVTDELIDFINWFYQQTGIPLDPIYTGKMLFGILDRIKKNKFKEGSKILAIHTGGLQGIKGMNDFLKKKNKKIIKVDDK